MDPVERRRTATVRKLSRSIHRHPCHRSRTVIAGNPTVGEKYLSSCPPLIFPSATTVTSAVPDPVQEVLHPNKSEPNTADEGKSNWKSTASATAKLVLRAVRDSADAFPPLKSVAGGLCYILENCEVWTHFYAYYPRSLQAFQRTKANKQAMESLAPRVKALSASLCLPVPKDDFKERDRRKKLEQWV